MSSFTGYLHIDGKVRGRESQKDSDIHVCGGIVLILFHINCSMCIRPFTTGIGN